MEELKITKEILEDLYLKRRLSTTQVGQLLKISQWNTRVWLKRFGIPTRSLSETRTKYPKTPFSGDLQEKAYILGLRTGDLYATPHRKLIRVEASSSKLIFIKMFEEIFSKYSVVKVYETKSKITEKSFKTYCYLDLSFEFLIKKLDEIPEWVLKDDKLFSAFLSGYVDAEGSWIITEHKIKKWKYKDPMFSIKSCDKAVLHQIHQKLRELGFKAHIRLERKAGTSTQLGKYHSDLYRVVIYGKDVAKLARVILPFSHHEDKQKKIRKIIELEKTKIEKLGTVEVPCIYCGRKKVSKHGGYFYKGRRFQRYRCPICKEVFSVQTIKKLESTAKISCPHCGGKRVTKYGFYSYKGKQHQSYKCPACRKVFTELTLEKNSKKDAEELENRFQEGFKYAYSRSFAQRLV
jgi:transposase-like protein